MSTPCVHLEQVSLSFGPVPVLRNLSWQAEAGQVTAVLGPNGAGKTTTMLTCEGLLRPDSGRVRVLGLDPHTDAAALRPRVGVMIQDGGLPVMAHARALLDHVARLYAHPHDTGELADLLGIGEFARTAVRRLSGGQRQRLALALAIVGRPELVFLDEPTAGLDAHGREVVWDLVRGLRAAGTSVILSTHVMEEAESLADQVVIMDRGVVVAAGSPGELTGAGEDVNRVHITGPIDAEALGALRSVATEHGLDVSVPSERALREVFLDLTGPEER
ncbi:MULTISPECIES: ABC transporter ATP-binding protein [unclassified Pseudactinotalea]|uniref:ABC transporter ATP-binding protein n=1 Tax=unclassified Pseudactinotalea TaxID=2649176 RepID=UPI003C7DE0D0